MRQYTQEEMQQAFMDYVVHMVLYWQKQPNCTEKDKISGVAFSILVMLDGCASGLPAFEILPSPHEGDKAFNQEEGENWWQQMPKLPEGVETIHGPAMLHDLLYEYLGKYE